jgi:DNA polymerase
MQEPEVFELDAKMNARGVRLDIANAKHLFEVTELLAEQANNRLALVTEGQVSSVNAVAQLSQWLARQGWNLPDLKRETVEATLEKSLPSHVREVLQIRVSGAKASTRKLSAMLNSVAVDGRIHGLLYYYGAHTGRWTSKLVQIQNLPRGMLAPSEQVLLLDSLGELGPSVFIERISTQYNNPLDVVSSLLRPLLCAEDGSELLVMDYKSIEPRVLMWLVGQEEALKAFRDQQDLYIQMATEIYKCPEEEVTKAMRQVGKAAVLGCGYGMGAKRFAQTCEQQGILLDEEEANDVVQSYRTLMNNVPRTWKKAEKAAIMATQRQGTGYSILGGKIQFLHDGTFLRCKLPSGRVLMYPFAHCVAEIRFGGAKPEYRLIYSGNVSQIGNKFLKKSIWGGTWIENIVQAISRDLMVDAMLKLEKDNMNPIFSVHDEIVCELPNATEADLGRMESILTDLPDWAEGLPVEAEGYLSTRYRK